MPSGSTPGEGQRRDRINQRRLDSQPARFPPTRILAKPVQLYPREETIRVKEGEVVGGRRSSRGIWEAPRGTEGFGSEDGF